VCDRDERIGWYRGKLGSDLIEDRGDARRPVVMPSENDAARIHVTNYGL
jgi:hypothetical protein